MRIQEQLLFMPQRLIMPLGAESMSMTRVAWPRSLQYSKRDSKRA